MKITEITVSAGRTFNHLYEPFSNFRPSVTATASLEAGDDTQACIDQLRDMVETEVEKVKAATLLKCEQEHDEREAELAAEREKEGFPF